MVRILVAVTSGDYHAQTRFDSIMDGGVEGLRVVAPKGIFATFSTTVSATRGRHRPVRSRLVGFTPSLSFGG